VTQALQVHKRSLLTRCLRVRSSRKRSSDTSSSEPSSPSQVRLFHCIISVFPSSKVSIFDDVGNLNSVIVSWTNLGRFDWDTLHSTLWLFTVIHAPYLTSFHISPVYVPPSGLPSLLSMRTTSPSVSITGPHSNLRITPSERPPSERPQRHPQMTSTIVIKPSMTNERASASFPMPPVSLTALLLSRPAPPDHQPCHYRKCSS
jgi:hypothetical protein